MGKRVFDILFAFFVLFLFSPVFILCMILIKITSKGPIFYAHARVGCRGKPFCCYKFRTMDEKADEKLKLLLASDPTLQKEWNVYFKLKVDPRVTLIGKFLRKTSLDELPQFFNVIRGDMSIVGPRPLTRHEVTYYLKERASTILSLRPGLTTLWVIKGRNNLSFKERIYLEEYYVNHRTFLLDMKLIFKTILIMIFPKGAY